MVKIIDGRIGGHNETDNKESIVRKRSRQEKMFNWSECVPKKRNREEKNTRNNSVCTGRNYASPPFWCLQ